MANYPLFKVCKLSDEVIYFFYSNNHKGTCPLSHQNPLHDVWLKKHMNFMPAEMFYPQELLDTVREKAKEYYVRQTS